MVLVYQSYPQVYNGCMHSFIYSYTCECGSELEFKSMNKASNEVMCMCGLLMMLMRYWAKTPELDSYPQVYPQKNVTDNLIR